MLMLSRLPGDQVVIGEGEFATELTVVSVRADRIKVRIETWMRPGDVLPVDDDSDVTLAHIDRNKAKLGFESPTHIRVVRKEVLRNANECKMPDA